MRTIRPISRDEQETTLRDLKAGDTVRVRTKSGRTARFVIQQVETEHDYRAGWRALCERGYRGAEAAFLQRSQSSGTGCWHL